MRYKSRTFPHSICTLFVSGTLSEGMYVYFYDVKNFFGNYTLFVSGTLSEGMYNIYATNISKSSFYR
ncbi:hypothetical protein Mzhil_0118 [Methanosalsum zhilinae DSM 4017]|uniref:Uncharacterized protein n=1 Tax=Methanosalsum zhilinae (strain DSM 4017 / NBRC 107636 / OCM 62 / WeN5) TaxID=679901 RepID=F7XMX9_METZD|nr:hypothetical protein Mzhil_0118 [Methanosalsum zhilinae DSM 4017]